MDDRTHYQLSYIEPGIDILMLRDFMATDDEAELVRAAVDGEKPHVLDLQVYQPIERENPGTLTDLLRSVYEAARREEVDVQIFSLAAAVDADVAAGGGQPMVLDFFWRNDGSNANAFAQEFMGPAGGLRALARLARVRGMLEEDLSEVIGQVTTTSRSDIKPYIDLVEMVDEVGVSAEGQARLREQLQALNPEMSAPRP